MVDFRAFEALMSQPSRPHCQSVQCFQRTYFTSTFMVQSDDTRWGNKDVDLRTCLDTFKACLQGAEGGHIRQTALRQPETTERHTDARFPTITTQVACVMSFVMPELLTDVTSMVPLEVQSFHLFLDNGHHTRLVSSQRRNTHSLPLQG